MKSWSYWPVLLIVTVFYIKCIQATDEFESENSDDNFILPHAEYHYKTTVEHLDQKFMVGWYKMVKGFISAIHSKSAETVDVLMKYFSHKKFVVPESIYELLKLQYAVIACVVIGLLYVVSMWVTGLIVFCCRCCCNNCGGKRVHDQTRKTTLWRKILILFLLIFVILLLIAVICMYVTHNSLSTNYSTVEKKTVIMFDDVQSMIKNTEDQMRFIAFNSVNETLINIFLKLNDIESFLTSEITEKMEPLHKSMIFANSVLSGTINFTYSLQGLSNAGDVLLNSSEEITNGLQNISLQLDEIKQKCPEDECKEIDPSQFNVTGLNFTIEFIGNAVNSLKNLNPEDYSKSLKNVTEIIRKLPKQVNEQTKPLQNDMKSSLNKVSEEFQKSTIKLFDDIFPEAKKQLSKINEITKQNMHNGKKYDNYGKYTTLGICIIMTVIVSFLVIGLFFGICGYQRNRPPTKRTTMSNVGGHLLLISVTWMFIFSGIFMLLTIFLFVFGSSADTYFCQYLYDEKLIMVNKIIENILNNSRTTIKMPYVGEIAPGDILNKCDSNETLFSIFDLENRLNLTEKLDFEKRMNFEEKIKELKNNIKLPKIKILSEEAETFMKKTIDSLKLEDIQNGILQFNKSENLNFEEQKTTLKNTANSNENLKTEIDKIMIDIENIEKRLEKFNEQKTNLLGSLTQIINVGQNYSGIIQQIYQKMKFEDAHLKENLTRNTIEIAKKFVTSVKIHADKLIKFILQSFKKNIAPCKPMWNIFASARSIVCEYYIQVLNGFWFALGWCLFCFIPTIIVAFKLSKHFLKMSKLGKPDEYKKEKPEYELELIDEESSSRSWVTQRNKIRPDNGWHPPVQHM